MNMELAYIFQPFRTPQCNLAARAIAEAHPKCHVRALRAETMTPGYRDNAHTQMHIQKKRVPERDVHNHMPGLESRDILHSTRPRPCRPRPLN